MLWTLYKLTNKRNGKVYIGQTTRSVSKRWRQHCEPDSGCLRLRRAITKYGPNAFDLLCLSTYETKEAVDTAEREKIALYRATERAYGYNIAAGGGGYRRLVCKGNHDLSLPASRGSDGSCKACKRAGAVVRRRSRELVERQNAQQRVLQERLKQRRQSDPELDRNTRELRARRSAVQYERNRRNPDAWPLYLKRKREYQRNKRTAEKAARIQDVSDDRGGTVDPPKQ